jgi:hypothetical protein
LHLWVEGHEHEPSAHLVFAEQKHAVPVHVWPNAHRQFWLGPEHKSVPERSQSK